VKTRLLFLLDYLRTSFWFIPLSMVSGAIALALGMVSLDHLLEKHFEHDLPWTYTGGPEGARMVLSVIASSMITVAGVVFSITIVTLTLASSQFGPRLLRGFIRDRANQMVLGTFLSTFVFCLLVLRTVRNDDYGNFVPAVSVVAGLLLGVMSLGVLIYFIHHTSTSIQATQVIANVTAELLPVVDRLFPADIGEARSEQHVPPIPEAGGYEVRARHSGYILAVNNELLLQLAVARDLLVHLEMRPGQFAVAGDLLARAWSDGSVSEEDLERLEDSFERGSQRTMLQDVEFGIDQLVEIAVRALSPGINDPFTAMNCLDRLREVFTQIVRRPVPSPYRFDSENRLRIIAYPVSFAAALGTALNQIRDHGRGHAPILLLMMSTLLRLAEQALRNSDLDAIQEQALRTARAGERFLDEHERRLLQAGYDDVQLAAKRSAARQASPP
jgi:uncharacterized membrane protein